MRDGHAQAANIQFLRLVDKRQQVLARHANGNVDLIQTVLLEAGIVNQRAQTVTDGVGDHSVDFRIGTDSVVMVDLGHLLVAELPGARIRSWWKLANVNGAPNLPARIREVMPISPMHKPTVGSLLPRMSCSIRTLSCG